MSLRVGRLKNQIFGLTIGVISIILVLCAFITGFLINTYYIGEKKASMVDAYSVIEESIATSSFYSDVFDKQLERYSSNKGFSILVVGADGSVVFSSVRDVKRELDRMYISIINNTHSNIIEQTDRYVIQNEIDPRLNEAYLILWGTLSDGNVIMIRTSIESILESTRLVRRFLIYIAIFAVIVGFILSFIISYRITKPILALNEISKKMTNLDFNARYETSKHPNEIDELGQSFNSMSYKLESTIDQLKNEITKLENEEKTRKDFVTDVSHELKTPISLISGYAEGLSEGIIEDEESRRFYLDVIIDESNRMNRLVRQLLDLSKAESIIDDPQISEFDLCDMINGILENNSLSITNANASVEFVCDSCIVQSDEFMVEQVLTNYISNAIHHVSGENKKICIKVEKQDLATKVSVFNTGNNISEEDLSHLWDKFYKADKSRSREYGGSGIGLSIVKANMEKLKGDYGVLNHLDGVEFYATIPNNA